MNVKGSEDKENNLTSPVAPTNAYSKTSTISIKYDGTLFFQAWRLSSVIGRK